MKKTVILILLSLLVFDTYSQKLPERSDVRKGNKLYGQKKYADAETAYRRGIEKNPKSAKAKYNLANAIYKQERYEDAAKLYKELIKPEIDSTKPAQTYHNMGNATLKQAIKDKEEQGQQVAANQEQLKESIEAYKKSLKLNPNDMETKSNLAYAQKLLAKNGGGGGGGNQNQQNKDQNQDKDKQNQDQNKDNQDQNQDQDKNDDKQNQDKEQNGKQPQEGMSKQDIDRMLEAVQAQEEKTKEKVDKQKAQAAKKEKPEKNW
jgi:tetratricopeptide (TPR) repeat protein